MALILLAHPDFQQSVANKAVITHLQAARPHYEIRDLAALYPDFRIDAAAEQQALLRHQTIVCQYPMFWYNMPAILKHYFDCVFTHGFAYGSTGDKLKGKNLVASITYRLARSRLPRRRRRPFPRVGVVQKHRANRVLRADELSRPLLFPRHIARAVHARTGAKQAKCAEAGCAVG